MSDMTKSSERKLFLFGRYSLALLLPKKWLTELRAKRGDIVSLKYDAQKGQIIVSFSEDTKKKPVTRQKSSPEDWEPIPQL